MSQHPRCKNTDQAPENDCQRTADKAKLLERVRYRYGPSAQTNYDKAEHTRVDASRPHLFFDEAGGGPCVVKQFFSGGHGFSLHVRRRFTRIPLAVKVHVNQVLIFAPRHPRICRDVTVGSIEDGSVDFRVGKELGVRQQVPTGFQSVVHLNFYGV